MDISRYFTLDGRINRARYILIPIAIGIFLYFLGLIAIFSESVILSLSYITCCIFATLINVCITVQRLHDIERPGYHLWFLLIPIYNIYLSLVLIFKKGTTGYNEYGADSIEYYG